MKLQIQRDVLLQPLQAVSGIVEKRHTLPILSNVLIEQSEGRLSLMATDMEIQVSTGVAAAGEDFRVTVSARKFLDILRALPDQAELGLEVQTNRLQVKAGKSRFNLQTLPAADFPKMADAGKALTTVTLPQKALRDLLLLVQYSMAHQDIRYYLNGVFVVVDGGQLTVVATDGHRLGCAARTLGAEQGKREIILPSKTVQELTKLLGENDDPVEIAIGASQVRLAFGDVVMVSKIIDGKFPDYTRVIPTTYTKAFTVGREQLLQTLQRAAILANEKFRGVRWQVSATGLRVSCTNNEQEEATEELEIRYAGEPVDIGFNITYLIDVLTNVQGESVECALGDSNSSMLMTLPDHKDFRYVVMPMRI